MTRSLSFSSWGKGELSPINRGHIDIEQYYASAESLDNMIVRPYAVPVRRAGTKYAGEVKNSAKDTRLIEFVFSVNESYIIEMGDLYFRFWDSDGVLITYDLDTIDAWADTIEYFGGDYVKVGTKYFICIQDHTSLAAENEPDSGTDWEEFWDEITYWEGLTGVKILEVTTPYTEAQIWDVDYAQKDDIIKLTHSSHDIAELRRYADDKWAFVQGIITGPPWEDQNEDKDNEMKPNVSGVGATGNVQSDKDTFTLDSVGRYIRIHGLNDDGEQGYAEITAYLSEKQVSITIIVALVGTGATTNWAFNAFYEDNYPAHVTFYEDRLVMASTPVGPQKIWLSRSAIYNDFNLTDEDSGGFDMVLNTEQANDIKWISSGESLASGTFGAEFTSRSPSDGSLNNTNKNARRQSGWGSEFIRPKKIGNRVYFVQRTGRKLREYFYLWDNDNYAAQDMTKYSDHITISGIVDMDYQRNQDSLLWCVLANGKMAILSRHPDEEVQAWTPWVSNDIAGQAEVKSIRFIPNPDSESDRGFIICERTIDGSTVKYIEYFDNHVVEDDTLQEDLYYVDCGVVYNQYDTTENNDLTIVGNTDAIYPDTVGNDLTRTTNPTPHYIAATVGNDATVTAVLVGFSYAIDDVNDTFSISDVGGTIKFINSDGSTFGTGLAASYAAGILTLIDITGTVPTGTVTGGFWGFSTDPVSDDGDYFMTAGAAYFAITDIGKTIKTIDVNGDEVNTFEIMSYTSTTVVGVNWTGGALIETVYTGGTWDFSTGEFSPVEGYTLSSQSSYFSIGDIGNYVGIIDITGSVVALLLITDFTSGTEVTVTLSSGTIDSGVISGGLWALPTTTLGGLSHLEDEIVGILMDGVRLSVGTVVSGAVSNTTQYFKAAVGLPFTSTIKTNPLNAQTPTGMAKGRIRGVNGLAVEIYRSLEMEYSSVGGTNDDDWFPIGVPEGTDATVLYTGTVPRLSFDGGKNYEGYIYLRQTKPYSMNVLGIYPELQIN